MSKKLLILHFLLLSLRMAASQLPQNNKPQSPALQKLILLAKQYEALKKEIMKEFSVPLLSEMESLKLAIKKTT